MGNENLVRLQKYLADCGIASRRKAEDMILAGAVKVNGAVAKLGDKVNPARDEITAHNKRVIPAQNLVYLMLHKPRGFVTTMSDEMGRKCVAQLVEDVGVRVYPVGRLDKDSEGLLLMTNDGAFAQALTHPSRHIPKTYRVTVRPGITDEQLTQLTLGVVIDGKKTSPAEVRVVTREGQRVVLEVILYEGRNRQIRKMCEALGLEVARLKRIAVGNVKLGMLHNGDWRMLSEQELSSLSALIKASSLGKEGKRP